jgi:CubicO group peptidase (beta-lactamase class C family)
VLVPSTVARRKPRAPRLISAAALLLVTAAASPAALDAQGAAPAAVALTFSSTQQDMARSRQVDELFRRWHTPESPGAAVLILRDGAVVHARGYGMANLDHGVPIRPSTVFDIASVSKQFGAMAIALLEADGRLSLDDDVRRYIPELPEFGHTITIRHLVHHTSGLRDWPGTLRMAGWDYQDIISFDQILRMAYAQRELNFVPGDDYAYSNTGYNILAEVVQRITGQPYDEWTQEHIFHPLGMRDTRFYADHMRIVPNRAESYRPTDDGYRRVSNALTALASSSLHTTVEDLARWALNFDSPVVGGARLVARMHERGVLNRGDTVAYAFGQSAGEYRGVRTVTHGGSWAGFRTTLHRFPDARFTVIILANTTDMNPGQLATQIADIFLADRLGPRPAAAASASGGALAGGDVRDRWAPSVAELRAYEGRYDSGELFTSWRLELRDGRLVARHFRSGDFPLQPVAPDRFASPIFGELRFVRDAGGGIVAFTANSDRVRGLRFERAR